MGVKRLNIEVSPEEYELLDEAKRNRTWVEAIIEEFGVEV